MAAENEGASAEVRLDTLPRYSLALVAGLHAIVLGTGALVLPFVVASWLSVSLGVPRFAGAFGQRARVARATARARDGVASALDRLLVFLAGLTWVVIAAGVYLSALYRSIGGAVTFGMLAFWAIAALFTVPIACWGLASTGGIPRRRRRAVVVGGGALLLLGLVFAFALGRIARLDRAPVIDGSAFARELARRATREEAMRTRSAPRPRSITGTLSPARSRSWRGETLLVTRLDAERRAVSKCLQSESAAGLLAALDREFGTGGSSGPALLDLVTASRCGPARVLVARRARDPSRARRGVLGQEVPASSPAGRAGGVLRIFARSPACRLQRSGTAPPRSTSSSGLSALPGRRALADRDPELRAPRRQGQLMGATSAKRRASTDEPFRSRSSSPERHILAAQRESGAFRYTSIPSAARRTTPGCNIPRQAGTTYALCQLGRERRTGKAVQRALSAARRLPAQAQR